MRRRAAAANAGALRQDRRWRQRALWPRKQWGSDIGRPHPWSCDRLAPAGHTPGGGNVVHNAKTCGKSAGGGVRSEKRQPQESRYSKKRAGSNDQSEEKK